MRPGRSVWIAGLGLLIALGIIAVVLGPRLADRSVGTLPWLSGSSPRGEGLEALSVYSLVPHFALTERSGRGISRDDLRGKVWIADFIYTRCTDTCPLQSAKMAQLQGEFSVETDLRLVSITVDPEHDTAAVLAEYAERYRADRSRWLFLTGTREEIYDLAAKGFRLGVVDPDQQARASGVLAWLGPRIALASHGSKGLVLHSSRFVLVDRQGRIRAYHRPDDDASLRRLREHVRAVLREP